MRSERAQSHSLNKSAKESVKNNNLSESSRRSMLIKETEIFDLINLETTRKSYAFTNRTDLFETHKPSKEDSMSINE